MTTQNVVFKHGIVEGPSAGKIVDAFKYAYDRDNPITVSFTLNGGAKIRLQVCAVAHEDGSGSSFNVTGNVTAISKRLPNSLWARINNNSFRVNLYYNARTNKGFVIFDSAENYNLCK